MVAGSRTAGKLAAAEPGAEDGSRARFATELTGSAGESTLAEDVRAGLRLRQKRLPAKYFYDERGSQLFEKICELPEYYLTRTEQRLLAEFSSEIIGTSKPSDLIEIDNGAAQKTR